MSPRVGMKLFRIRVHPYEMEMRCVSGVTAMHFELDTPFSQIHTIRFLHSAIGRAMFTTHADAVRNFTCLQRNLIAALERRAGADLERKRATALHAIDWATSILES